MMENQSSTPRGVDDIACSHDSTTEHAFGVDDDPL
jgi:hypothetical protein